MLASRLIPALVFAALAPGAANAQPTAQPLPPVERATEALAPSQLRMAQTFLEQARAAQALGEYDLARRLAQQAALDARLTWGMTDSAFLRNAASDVYERSARLRYELSPGRIRGSAPPSIAAR